VTSAPISNQVLSTMQEQANTPIHFKSTDEPHQPPTDPNPLKKRELSVCDLDSEMVFSGVKPINTSENNADNLNNNGKESGRDHGMIHSGRFNALSTP
jgi:hypothetical protein